MIYGNVNPNCVQTKSKASFLACLFLLSDRRNFFLFLISDNEIFENRNGLFLAFACRVRVMQNQLAVRVSGDCSDGREVNSGLEHSGNCRMPRVEEIKLEDKPIGKLISLLDGESRFDY